MHVHALESRFDFEAYLEVIISESGFSRYVHMALCKLDILQLLCNHNTQDVLVRSVNDWLVAMDRNWISAFYLKNAPCYRAAKIWNSLSQIVTGTISQRTFKELYM